MPNEVIDCVHRIAHQEKANRSLIFQNQNRELLSDKDDDEDDESFSQVRLTKQQNMSYLSLLIMMMTTQRPKEWILWQNWNRT